MSTILEALRKARQAPPRDNVDAPGEILNARSHDYLATAPDVPAAQTQTLKILLSVAGVLIVILLGVLIGVLLHFRGTAPAGETASAGSVPLPEIPVREAPAAVPAPPAATPPVSRVEIVVAAPVAPPPQAAVPADTPPPPAAAADPARDGASDFFKTLKLDGIVWDSIDPMAMINGRPVRVGTEIGEGSVFRINRDSVVVVLKGREFILRP